MAVQEHQTGSHRCQCALCAEDRPFEIPPGLVNACLSGDLVVFAGAGTSTECRSVLPFTLYDDFCGELGIEDDPPFPTVMGRYEELHGRPALLKEIKSRLDNIKSFPELDGLASRFHRELATVFSIRTIFTTNWDDYFERECAATPFITEEDWGFWRSEDRKVFKLHGSITSPGSIVATDKDYKKCYRRLDRGLVGAQLKTLLATKTVVFIGYSFGDSDFNAIYRTLKRTMKDVLPRAFIVTLDDREPPPLVGQMHVVRTGAAHFMRELKKQLPAEVFLPDERFDVLPFVHAAAVNRHRELANGRSLREHPEDVHCLSYQDGLIHAFEHQMANLRAGGYSHVCHVEAWISLYEGYRAERLRARIYYEVAYIDGYLTGMYFLLADDESRPDLPFYYLFGAGDLKTVEDYTQAAETAQHAHKSAYAEATRIAARYDEGMVVHHPPMLKPA